MIEKLGEREEGDDGRKGKKGGSANVSLSEAEDSPYGE
jgi:hypothetical protein